MHMKKLRELDIFSLEKRMLRGDFVDRGCCKCTKEIFNFPFSVVTYPCSLIEIKIYSGKVDASECKEKD